MDNILAKASQQFNFLALAYSPHGSPYNTFPFSVMTVGNMMYFRQVNIIVRYLFHETWVSILAAGLVIQWPGTRINQYEGQLVFSINLPDRVTVTSRYQGVITGNVVVGYLMTRYLWYILTKKQYFKGGKVVIQVHIYVTYHGWVQ